jgi:hypothetical protein
MARPTQKLGPERPEASQGGQGYHVPPSDREAH